MGFPEIYLKLKGIQGECLDGTFRTKGAIQLSNVSFNGSAPPDRPRNSAIAGKQSKSAWVSDSFEPEEEDPEDLSKAFRTLFDEPDEAGEETSEKKEDEEFQWPFTITCSKELDSASADLFNKFCLYSFLSRDQAGAQQVQIDSGKLWVRKFSNGKSVPYCIWHFKLIQIVSFSWRSLPDGGMEETFSFRFQYCRMEYLPQLNDGTMGTAIVSEWDLQANKAEAPAISDGAVGV